MIAFVFSSGGNRGAMQAGAIQVLLAHGIQFNRHVELPPSSLELPFWDFSHSRS